MTGRDLIRWIQKHDAEELEIEMYDGLNGCDHDMTERDIIVAKPLYGKKKLYICIGLGRDEEDEEE